MFKVVPVDSADGLDKVWAAYKDTFEMSIRTILPQTMRMDVLAGGLWWRMVAGNGDTIGIAGLENINWIDGVFEPFIYIYPTYRKAGYGRMLADQMFSIAFGDLNLRRAQATVLEHSPSIPLLDYLGFTLEGTLKAVRLVRGVPKDAYLYALVRD